MTKFFAGLFFAALWGSGSVATKLGLNVAQPLILINARFVLAAGLMLAFAFLISRNRLPKQTEWLPLFLCGALSMAIYPTAFVFAMKYVTAGIGTLGSAACPLIISVLNAVWLRQKITRNIWLGLLIGLLGVAVAIYPLLLKAYATPFGVFLLSMSMICYSVGTVYYQSIDWALPRLSINGWQVFFGACLLLPFSAYFFDASQNNFDITFWLSVFWLVLPISVVAVQLWLYLLKVEPTQASLWLFLCPIFGFFFSNQITGEPITIFTIIGTVLVIIGLYLGKKPS
jgi:probable blue pigment (indigoidine) exporter